MNKEVKDKFDNLSRVNMDIEIRMKTLQIISEQKEQVFQKSIFLEKKMQKEWIELQKEILSASKIKTELKELIDKS